MTRRTVDVVCPSCGSKLRASLVDPLPDGPNIFAPYPHRTRGGWCHKGTWTATVQLELGEVA